MTDWITQRVDLVGWGRTPGSTVVAVALLLALASSSSVYCQSATAPSSAQASDWRLTVTRPVSGGSVQPRATICYEITGATREPELALDIALRRPDGDTAATARVDARVGRSSVVVDLTPAGEGTFDLHVQLVVNGSAAGRPAVVIQGLMVRQDTQSVTCS